MFSFARLNNIVTVSTKMFEDVQRISKQQQVAQQQLLIFKNTLTTWSGKIVQKPGTVLCKQTHA
jgi:hypothetical protein